MEHEYWFLNQALNYPVGGMLYAAFDVLSTLWPFVKDAGHSLYSQRDHGSETYVCPEHGLPHQPRGTNLSLRAQ